MVKTAAKRTIAKQSKAKRKYTDESGSRIAKQNNASARNGPNGKPNHLCKCLHGGMPEHLPLPRVVGPYHVIRATRIFNSSQAVHLFGFWMNSGMQNSPEEFTEVCSIASGNVNSAMNAGGNTNRYGISTGLAGMHVAPAAITVRISNPNALQTTSGMVNVGQTTAITDIRDYTVTWATYVNSLIAQSHPAAFGAAQLAIKSVDVTAVPVEIDDLCSFKQMNTISDGVVTLASANNAETLAGFAPVYVYNPSGINLSYEVMCEYRVRPGSGSPFHSSMKLHKPSSDKHWYDAIVDVIKGGIAVTEAVAPVLMAAL